MIEDHYLKQERITIDTSQKYEKRYESLMCNEDNMRVLCCQTINNLE